jgi:hypothetical protein
MMASWMRCAKKALKDHPIGKVMQLGQTLCLGPESPTSSDQTAGRPNHLDQLSGIASLWKKLETSHLAE